MELTTPLCWGGEVDHATKVDRSPEDATVNGVTVFDWFAAMVNDTDEWRNIVDEALE